MRGASARSMVAGSGGRTSSTMASTASPAWSLLVVAGRRREVEVDHRRLDRAGTREAPHAGLQGGHQLGGRDHVLDGEAAPPGDDHPVAGDLDGAGEQRPAEAVGQPGCQVTTVGRGRQHDHGLAGQHRGQRGGPGRGPVALRLPDLDLVDSPARPLAALAAPAPTSTARPPHSATTSSAPAGSTPSRTGTERDHRRPAVTAPPPPAHPRSPRRGPGAARRSRPPARPGRRPP